MTTCGADYSEGGDFADEGTAQAAESAAQAAQTEATTAANNTTYGSQSAAYWADKQIQTLQTQQPTQATPTLRPLPPPSSNQRQHPGCCGRKQHHLQWAIRSLLGQPGRNSRQQQHRPGDLKRYRPGRGHLHHRNDFYSQCRRIAEQQHYLHCHRSSRLQCHRQQHHVYWSVFRRLFGDHNCHLHANREDMLVSVYVFQDIRAKYIPRWVFIRWGMYLYGKFKSKRSAERARFARKGA